MKYVLSFFILSFLLVSCSTNTLINKIPMDQSFENEINNRGKDNSAEIILIDEQIISAERIEVQGDSLKYLILPDSDYSVISLGYVKEIRFSHHIEGALFGMATGGLVLGAEGYRRANNSPGGSRESITGQLYMAEGALIGALFGGLIGVERNYEFVKNEEQIDK